MRNKSSSYITKEMGYYARDGYTYPNIRYVAYRVAAEFED